MSGRRSRASKTASRAVATQPGEAASAFRKRVAPWSFRPTWNVGERRSINFSEFRQIVRRYRPSRLLPELAALAASTQLIDLRAAFDLVDDLGQPWTAARANEQLRRLGVEYRPGRGRWFGRLVRRVQPFRGDCPVCAHDWPEHIPADGQCSECTYEIEHDAPDAPTVACTLQPPVLKPRG